MVVECGEIIRNGRSYTIKGRIDGILTDLARADRLLEHKAPNHFTFQRYRNGEFPLDYLTQVAFYMVGLKKIQPEIAEAILLVKNKNTAQYLEFYIGYEFPQDRLEVLEVIASDGTRNRGDVFENLYRNGIAKFQEVERYREAGTLPDRQYGPGTWHCDFCSYSEICYSGYKEEIEQMATGVELEGISEPVREYFHLSTHLKEVEKKKDELNEIIKKNLKGLGVRGGRVDGLAVSLSVQERQTVDKGLIPPGILEEVTRASLIEVLNVRLENSAKRRIRNG
jgi:CRISPR/Cas system-associated exonuclease Cas4 (RecB family)